MNIGINQRILRRMTSQIDKGRIAFFVAASSFGVAAGWYGQPLIHGNSDAVGVIVNVFSILAGFLVTIMTLLGEPTLIRGRSWRSDKVKSSNYYRRLVRHKWLFISYLSVLGLIFVATLLKNMANECHYIIWLERAYLGLAAFAFVMSLALPHRLMNLQMTRLDEMIEERKQGK